MSSKAQPKQGTIKFYNEQKGYGFITDSDSGQEIFFHRSRVNGEITRKDQGNSVFYSEYEGKKGVEAEVYMN
jgi:CspA family cold shock protein